MAFTSRWSAWDPRIGCDGPEARGNQIVESLNTTHIYWKSLSFSFLVIVALEYNSGWCSEATPIWVLRGTLNSSAWNPTWSFCVQSMASISLRHFCIPAILWYMWDVVFLDVYHSHITDPGYWAQPLSYNRENSLKCGVHQHDIEIQTGDIWWVKGPYRFDAGLPPTCKTQSVWEGHAKNTQ